MPSNFPSRSPSAQIECVVRSLVLPSSSQTSFPLESPTASVGMPSRHRGRRAPLRSPPRVAPARARVAPPRAPPQPGHPGRVRAPLLRRPVPRRPERPRTATRPCFGAACAAPTRAPLLPGFPGRGPAGPCRRPATAGRPPPAGASAALPRAGLAVRRPWPRRAAQAKTGEAGVELGAGLPLTCGARLSAPLFNVSLLFIF